MFDQARRYVRASLPILPWAAVGLLAAVVLLVLGWFTDEALGGTLPEYASQAIPTTIAVVAGIPVALWLLRVGNRVDDQRRLEARQERRRVVLQAILGELRNVNGEMHGDRAVRPRRHIYPPLSDQAWRAFADGGELQAIDDPQLILTIAWAYHRVEATNSYERKLLDYTTDPTHGLLRPGQADAMTSELRETLEKQDEFTIDAVGTAIAALEAATA